MSLESRLELLRPSQSECPSLRPLRAGTSFPDVFALDVRARTNKCAVKHDMPAIIEVSVGMKVMVTTNIATDMDIANGARGIVDIILGNHEPEYISENLRQS